MKRSMEENRQQNASLVYRERERLEAVARRRDQLRKEHAAHGKEQHERHYGSAAGAQRAALQAAKGEQRKQLKQKMSVFEAERSQEQADGAARRSASADRVRQNSGARVLRGVLEEAVRERNAEARAKRAQSARWAEEAQQQRTLMAQPKLTTMSFTRLERQKAQVEELKERVPDFDELRMHLSEDTDRKKREASWVREANQSVKSAAKAVLMEEARDRKAVHDWVKENKDIEAPSLQLSDGAGGIAGSRKAAAAASFARGVLLHTKKTPTTSAPGAYPVPTAALRRGSTYIFEPGPIGLELQETPAGVAVQGVVSGSAASSLQVPTGGLMLAVNALPLTGLSKYGVQRAISKANWPMTLQIAPCLHFSFQEKGVLGLTVQETQNGIAVREVSPGSMAEEAGVPIGGLIVAANGESATGMGKGEVGTQLRERPLALQVVPREAAYLFRPKGIFRSGSRNGLS
jgi:hypothetical protein